MKAEKWGKFRYISQVRLTGENFKESVGAGVESDGSHANQITVPFQSEAIAGEMYERVFVRAKFSKTRKSLMKVSGKWNVLEQQSAHASTLTVSNNVSSSVNMPEACAKMTNLFVIPKSVWKKKIASLNIKSGPSPSWRNRHLIVNLNHPPCP